MSIKRIVDLSWIKGLNAPLQLKNYQNHILSQPRRTRTIFLFASPRRGENVKLDFTSRKHIKITIVLRLRVTRFLNILYVRF